MKKYILSFGLVFMILFISCSKKEYSIVGELKKWHTITLVFDGPEAGERDGVNPFLYYRLDVTFRKGDREIIVPGFFAADGNASETSAGEGNKWMVRFTPDEEGTWEWEVSFKTGKHIAVDPNTKPATEIYFHGTTGKIEIGPSDKSGPDFRANGMIVYDKAGYFRFANEGKYWIKGGSDSPENFLAFHDFDGTWDAGGVELPTLDSGLHRFLPHVNDWQENDPVWQERKGKGIIGAINYLAEEGVNSQYMITMNVAGDGQDVWPWIAPDEKMRYDVSKLEQWEIVFSHMERKGMLIHMLTQERENDTLLDHGDLGMERKLYYRELVARFSHHLALVWNLGEETTRATGQIKAYSNYIREIDPYDHPINLHTNIRGSQDDVSIDPHEVVYNPLLGFGNLDALSLQISDISLVHDDVIKWIKASENTNKRWIVNMDEIGHWSTGLTPDGKNNNHTVVRYKALWGTLMAGGGGVEWYFGWDNNGPDSDLSSENFRSRNEWWDYNRYAMHFFRDHLPFWRMRSYDSLTKMDTDYCFAEPGNIYAVYMPSNYSNELNLETFDEKFTVEWFNPRTGEGLIKGSVITINGPGWQKIGYPPYETEEDWVALVKKKE